MKIKICCISSVKESSIAIKHGASALGLVAKMPSGPGTISDELIFEIAKTIPPPIDSFLLTCETLASHIIQHHQRCLTSTIQLVDALYERDYKTIRAALPAIKIVQVIHVVNERSIDEALEIAEMADALLLDSGNPALAIKQLGGTGKTHNWNLSRKIVEQTNTPVFLAGGINEHNAKEAIETVNPYGLDLCSSLRTNGQLDEWKLEMFFKAVSSSGMIT